MGKAFSSSEECALTGALEQFAAVVTGMSCQHCCAVSSQETSTEQLQHHVPCKNNREPLTLLGGQCFWHGVTPDQADTTQHSIFACSRQIT